MKRALLIINPVSGKMKAKSTLLDVVKELQSHDMLVIVAVTERRGHATELAAAAKQNGFDVVLCFGGDGTLNETICGLMADGSALPLGYIPAGSTNDFATSMKLPGVPVKAAAVIGNGTEHEIDVGCFDGKRFFTYVAAFGVFTATSYSVPQGMKNIFGHLAYIMGSVKEIGNLRSYHVRMELDDREVEGDYMFGAVANSTSVAGVVKLHDSLVDMGDGKFEVALIKKPRSIVELNKIVQALTSSNFENGGVEFYKSSKIKVISDEGLKWTLDGEFAESGKEAVIINIHRAVRFIK